MKVFALLFLPTSVFLLVGCFAAGTPTPNGQAAVTEAGTTELAPAPTQTPVDYSTLNQSTPLKKPGSVEIKAAPPTHIDICSRGVIGDNIASAVGATSCKDVSVEKMAALRDLQISYLHNPIGDGYYKTSGDDGISQIPAGSFAGLISLKSLYIYTDKLIEVPDEAFKGLEKLEALELGWSIQKISKRAFVGLPALRILRLNGLRDYKEMEEGTLKNLTALRELTMNACWYCRVGNNGRGLEKMPKNELLALSELTILDMQKNSLTESPLLTGLANLKTLNLENNRLIDAPDLTGLINLEEIYLEGNKF